MKNELLTAIKKLNNEDLTELTKIVELDEWNDFKNLLFKTNYDASQETSYKDQIIYLVENHKEKLFELFGAFLYEDVFDAETINLIKQYVIENKRDPYRELTKKIKKEKNILK